MTQQCGSVRVLIPTTEGPASISNLLREADALGESLVVVAGMTEFARISDAYDAFVSGPNGVIEPLFGGRAWRLELSRNIDTGRSWEAGVVLAHALQGVGRLAIGDAPADLVVWATGIVEGDKLTIAGADHVDIKLRESIASLGELARNGVRVTVVMPTANLAELSQDLVRETRQLGIDIAACDTCADLTRLAGVRLPRFPALHKYRRSILPAATHKGIALGVVLTVLVGAASLRLAPALFSTGNVMTMMAEPSIAVLPFAGSDEDGGNSRLAEEIATELLLIPRGFNIRIRPAVAYRDANLDAKVVGRELDVRYLVLGTIQREGAVLRLNPRLIEADTGQQIWADPFDYVPSQAGAKHRAAARIARLATDALAAAESKRPLPAEVKADHYAILGRVLLSGKGNAKVNHEAMALFQKALDLDPSSVPALQGYARTKISAVDGGWVPSGQRALWLDQSEAAISRIIAQRPRSYGAYRLRGSLLRARGDPEQAIKAFERALELNSSYASAYAELGRTKIEIGRASETISDVRKAQALSQADPADHSWLLWAGQAAIHTGDYADALDWLQKAREADFGEETNVNLWLAIARVGLGQLEAGRSLMSVYLAKYPSFSLRTWNETHPRSNPIVAEQRARIEALLRQLNVPAGKLSAAAER